MFYPIFPHAYRSLYQEYKAASLLFISKVTNPLTTLFVLLRECSFPIENNPKGKQKRGERKRRVEERVGAKKTKKDLATPLIGTTVLLSTSSEKMR